MLIAIPFFRPLKDWCDYGQAAVCQTGKKRAFMALYCAACPNWPVLVSDPSNKGGGARAFARPTGGRKT
jgi:hypothetical protein